MPEMPFTLERDGIADALVILGISDKNSDNRYKCSEGTKSQKSYHGRVARPNTRQIR